MCGICGLWYPFQKKNEEIISDLNSISDKLIHRGPDDYGIWTNKEHAVGLSHRRLSILDLSTNGKQPMKSKSGRFIIIFNGEIYNHKDLREKINLKNKSKNTWRGHSDTEILVEAIELFGLENTLKNVNGMFAFALWDNKNKELILVRDRFGEKPLYWGFANLDNHPNKEVFVFASEISGIFSLKGFQKSINYNALSFYFKNGYINQPQTIQEKINQLRPGELLRITPNKKGLFDQNNISKYFWWNSKKIFSESFNKKTLSDNNNDQFYIDELEQILQKVINQQSTSSDMPVGCFLSGGIDSSLITTLVQKESSKPINSYTLKFDSSRGGSKDFDESIYANQISRHLGTDHTEVVLNAEDIIEIIPRIGKIYSEPFSDPSQVPSYLICKNIKDNGISVALSGDGGDELFGGYNRHSLIPQINKYFGWMPLELKIAISKSLLFLPVSRKGLIRDKIQKFSNSIIASGDPLEMYQSLKNLYLPMNEQHNSQNIISFEKESLQSCNSLEESLMFADTISYLPDDILVKLDRAAMANSLETRVPFLDNRVVEFAWDLPLKFKLRKKYGTSISKWCLRQILYKYIPKKIIDRPKKGFSMPIGPWLRGPLRPWLMDMLSYEKIKKQGYLDPNFVERLISQHLSCREDNSLKLWNLLMWQAWLENWY